MRDQKKLTRASQVLIALVEVGGVMQHLNLLGSMKFAPHVDMRNHIVNRNKNFVLHSLKRQGLIKFEYREAKRIVRLTKRGQIEALFRKSKLPAQQGKWDGLWRIVIFDIPEYAKHIREKLRKLLKAYGFVVLQASVYVSPWGLSPDSVAYLKQSGLSRYIRVLRVDKFDDDKDLKRYFKL